MLILSFMYWFVNKRWEWVVGEILDKNQGVKFIVISCMLGILEAYFNTALKIIFVKRLTTIAEATGLNDEQWDSCQNWTSTDVELLKLMAFEYGQYAHVRVSTFTAD